MRRRADLFEGATHVLLQYDGNFNTPDYRTQPRGAFVKQVSYSPKICAVPGGRRRGGLVSGDRTYPPGAATKRSCQNSRRKRRTSLMILQSLAGLPAFLVYFCTGLVAIIAYLFVYTRITAHNEFQLIRDNDPAAAIALGLSLLGFVAPLVSAIAHSANVLDCLIWAMIALIVQIVVFFIVKVPVANLSARIGSGELETAIWVGLASLAAGELNAA